MFIRGFDSTNFIVIDDDTWYTHGFEYVETLVRDVCNNSVIGCVVFGPSVPKSTAVAIVRNVSTFAFRYGQISDEWTRVFLDHNLVFDVVAKDLRKSSIEKFLCIDKYGLVLQTEGTNRSINFTQHEQRLLRDIYTLEMDGRGIHNHPSVFGLDYPPSFRDIYMSVVCGLSETRVVTPNGMYAVKPFEAQTWDRNLASGLMAAYEQIKLQNKRLFDNVFGKTPTTFDEELAQIKLQSNILEWINQEIPVCKIQFTTAASSS